MRGDRTFGSFRFLLISTALSTSFLLSPQSALSSDRIPAATFTLADMASQAETQQVRPGQALQGGVPLASVGAKGGMPRPSAARQAPQVEAYQPETAGAAPEAYETRLSRIVTRMRDDLEEDAAGGPSETASGEIPEAQVAGSTRLPPAPLPDLAAEEDFTPEALVFHPHEPSEAPAAEGERRFTLVGPVPQAADGSDDPGQVEAGRESPAVETPSAVPNRLRATGLTLADMAMEATPAPPKQARRQGSLPGVPLARLVLPSAGSARTQPPRAPWGSVLAVPRQRPYAGLSFPEPRGLTERFMRGTVERPSHGFDDEVWQYPASASLARFLGDMERLPTPAHRRGPTVPPNLQQVARRAEVVGSGVIWTRRPNPGFTFSFSREAFAANQLTTGPYGTRRQAVMDELRRVFAPLR